MKIDPTTIRTEEIIMTRMVGSRPGFCSTYRITGSVMFFSFSTGGGTGGFGGGGGSGIGVSCNISLVIADFP